MTQISERPVAFAVVAVALAVATVTDVRARRVPLWLTVGGVVTGLMWAVATGGQDGLRDGAIGLVVGVLVLAPFVALGGIGAGDALLLGLIGAWLGWTFVLWTTWWTSLAGGVLALIALARKQRTFAYVPALALGAVAAALIPLKLGQ
ncbi:MAG: A24 family peptidase [Chloroflexota bacterium]